MSREILNSRERQTDSTPVDKYNFTWTFKGVRCYQSLNYRGVYKVTTINVRRLPLSIAQTIFWIRKDALVGSQWK